MKSRKIKSLKWILVILWMILIFSFSAQPADISGKMSLTTGRFIGRMLLPRFEEQTIEQQTKFAVNMEHGIRKTAHFMEYTILAMLIMLAMGEKMLIRKYQIFFFGVLYAISDEVHQLFVQGRSCQIKDMLLDSMGVLTGILCYVFVRKAWQENKRRLVFIPFIIYMILVCFYTMMNRDVTGNMQYELTLFWSYRLAWGQGMMGYQEEILNNIWLFVPLGIMIPIICPQMQKIWKVLLCGLTVSFGIETIQLLFKIGLFEFDDMFNNTIGSGLGYLAFLMIKIAVLYGRKLVEK
ncbi:MAG: VanZ family protein [Lachnospiraceae bacterium]